MMTRKITILVLIAGIVLGATGTEGFNIYHQFHNNRIFQERLHCKAVADAYIKENDTGQGGVFLLPGKVDYSPARNSCVAGVDTMPQFSYPASPLPSDQLKHKPWKDSQKASPSYAPNLPEDGGSKAFESTERVTIQDLLSGETLFSLTCTIICNAESTYIDSAFKYVINNASKPIALEKEASAR